jgi:hypothetical protein
MNSDELSPLTKFTNLLSCYLPELARSNLPRRQKYDCVRYMISQQIECAINCNTVIKDRLSKRPRWHFTAVRWRSQSKAFCNQKRVRGYGNSVAWSPTVRRGEGERKCSGTRSRHHLSISPGLPIHIHCYLKNQEIRSRESGSLTWYTPS